MPAQHLAVRNASIGSERSCDDEGCELSIGDAGSPGLTFSLGTAAHDGTGGHRSLVGGQLRHLLEPTARGKRQRQEKLSLQLLCTVETGKESTQAKVYGRGEGERWYWNI